MSEPITIMITEGDPAGIGPEVAQRAAAQWPRPDDCRLVLLGFPSHFPISRGFRPLETILSANPPPGLFWANPGPEEIDRRVSPGVGSAEGARAAVRCIEVATDAAMRGAADAICTAPINKEVLALAGYAYPGHTEMLAERSRAKSFAMMLTGGGLRVVLATIHEALARVPSLLTKEKIEGLIDLTHESMGDFGFERARIGIAGLNPHAGEGGRFGREEIEIISPAVEACRARGIEVSGPFSGDTIFHRALEREFDAVIAMYHDQALIPVKTLDFHRGVNITLGLPFVRTSPDHGTAYDLAGKGTARIDSFLAALDAAYSLARKRRERKPAGAEKSGGAAGERRP